MRRRRAAPRIDRAEFPILAGFFRGYLHEDFEVEHGSAAAALETYQRDLSVAERASLREECERLLEVSRDLTLTAQRALVAEEFGAAWRPGRGEVQTLLRRGLG
jgi:hypothetical protein